MNTNFWSQTLEYHLQRCIEMLQFYLLESDVMIADLSSLGNTLLGHAVQLKHNVCWTQPADSLLTLEHTLHTTIFDRSEAALIEVHYSGD